MKSIVNESKTILSIVSKGDGEIEIQVAQISEDSIPTVIGLLEQLKFQLLTQTEEPVLPILLTDKRFLA
jgi:hypothetical protein